MKGYFSQLARQSGLRYAKGNTNSPATAAEKKVEAVAPLHREETILAAPSPPREASKTDEKAYSSDQPIALQKDESNDAPVHSSSQIPVSPDDEQIYSSDQFRVSPKKEAAENTAFETSETSSTVFAENQMSAPENRFSAGLAASEHSAAADLPIVEPIVRAENDAGTTDKKEFAGSPVNSVVLSENPEESSLEAIDQQPSRTEYFKKTAELLETGTADKLEIQQILLREVTEWVSHAPAPIDAENLFETESEAEAVIAPDEKTAFFRHEPAESAAENITEQSFHLSIGSISIVVEEENNQTPAAAENPVRPHDTSKTEKRRTSRLSRYYI